MLLICIGLDGMYGMDFFGMRRYRVCENSNRRTPDLGIRRLFDVM